MNKTLNNSLTAWVAGATGLIGQSLLKQLIDKSDYERIIAFIRPKTSSALIKHPKVHYFECDWEALTNSPESFQAPSSNVDALFCALGSTKKKTPNKEAYRRIDIAYPEAFAKLGKQHGAQFYGLVSANGANSKLPSFYLSMKKEVEQSIGACNFTSSAFARPSLLLGERNEFRLGEKASETLCKLLPGNLKAIHADDVAATLINASLSRDTGNTIYESAQMQGTAQA